MLVNKKINGFSMIELLIVIAIITFLSAIIFVYANDARIKARDAKRLSDLRSLQTAVEILKKNNEHDVVPMPLTWSEFKTMLAPEISLVPKDPQNSTDYHYVYCHHNDGTAYNKKGKYIIATSLEIRGRADDDFEITIPNVTCVGSDNSVTSGINCHSVTGNINSIELGQANIYCIGYQ